MPDLFKSVSLKLGQRYKLLLVTFAVVLYAVPFLFFRGFSHGAVFAKYDGIDGESTDAEHKEWINILSYGVGITRQTASDGKVYPKLDIDSTSMSQAVNKASPILMLNCATDSPVPTSYVEYTKDIQGRQQTYLKWEMKNVRISSYQFGGSSTAVGNDLVPIDQVSLNFEEVKMTYIPFDENGEPMEPVVGVCRFENPAGQ